MKKVIKAPAKINLCLRVNGKREDGYHDLSMIMQTISLFDVLELEITKENNINILNNEPNRQIRLKCNQAYIPTDERNLVYKVVDYIYREYNINDKIDINLKKMIPTSGGLGGGSSDAASMLIFLNRFYKLNLKNDELAKIASIFGSDIPFFIYKKECICEGRGEIIKQIKPFNNYFVLIATPNIRVSTKEIFSKVDSFEIPDSRKQLESIAFDNCINAIKNKNLNLLTNNIFNNLEIVTESMFEDVTVFKKRMVELGALTALMSGSGPTVFGIFSSYIKALNCKNILKKEHKDSFAFLTKPI